VDAEWLAVPPAAQPAGCRADADKHQVPDPRLRPSDRVTWESDSVVGAGQWVLVAAGAAQDESEQVGAVEEPCPRQMGYPGRSSIRGARSGRCSPPARSIWAVRRCVGLGAGGCSGAVGATRDTGSNCTEWGVGTGTTACGNRHFGEQPTEWCGWRDLNSHVRGHRNLSPARLPIPPHPRGPRVPEARGPWRRGLWRARCTWRAG
jgi:hypothetical protein